MKHRIHFALLDVRSTGQFYHPGAFFSIKLIALFVTSNTCLMVSSTVLLVTLLQRQLAFVWLPWCWSTRLYHEIFSLVDFPMYNSGLGKPLLDCSNSSRVANIILFKDNGRKQCPFTLRSELWACTLYLCACQTLVITTLHKWIDYIKLKQSNWGKVWWYRNSLLHAKP